MVKEPRAVLVNGKLYRSLSEAATAINVSHTRLSRHLRYSNKIKIMKYEIEAVVKKTDLLEKKTPSHPKGLAHRCAKLSPHTVLVMRKRHSDGETYAQLAREYGVSPTVAANAVKGRTWAWLK